MPAEACEVSLVACSGVDYSCLECFGLLGRFLASYAGFFRFSFRLFSFALNDKAFGVHGWAIDSIDAHWAYEWWSGEKLPLSEGHNTALNRKAFRKAAGRRWRCWGLSDTRLIRGSSSEVVVCTMKHADGDTMTHMLHLTGEWFRCVVSRKKKPGPHNRVLWHDGFTCAEFSECACERFYLLVWFERKTHCHYS